MSHVSALPGPPSGIASGLDDTVEAAQYALSTLSNLSSSDVIDTAVGVVSAAAVARLVYEFAGRPDVAMPLRWVFALVRGGGNSCN